MQHAAPMLAALLLAGCIAGCTQADTVATAVRSTAQAQATPTLSTADATFLNRATRAGIAEVAFGQLARTEASRAATRDFARRMVDAHTTMNQDLVRLAERKGLAPITDIDADHHAEFGRLQALRGRAFDRAYLNQQATDHRALLVLCQDEARAGADPDVRAFAAVAASAITRHVANLRALGAVAVVPAS